MHISIGWVCQGPIYLCENCSDAEEARCIHNEGTCLHFRRGNRAVIGGENKAFVVHNDTNADCCWYVFKKNNFEGESRLISGREYRNGIFIDTNCTRVDFDVQSLRRKYKRSGWG